MRKKTIRSLIIFSLVFIVGYFAYLKVKDMLSGSDNVLSSVLINKGEPTMKIIGFRLEESKGEKLEWVLSASEAKMFKDKGEILFSTVNTQVMGDDSKKGGYTIKSNTGTYYTKDDKINFDGGVGIKTSDGYDFLTDSVSYVAKGKKMETNAPVTISGTSKKGEKIYVSGKGLKGNADSGDFNILDNVETKVGKHLQVQSQNAMVNVKKSKVVFSKGIIAKKDKINIKGDKLEVSYGKSGDVNDIDVEGNVKLNVDKKMALCDNAVIKGNSTEIVLTGKPELHMSGDIMVGERIVFNTENDEVFVERVKADVSQKRYKK